MTAKWALFIDVAKCHNCRNCYIACKDEHVGNAYPGYAAPQPRHGHDWIAISTRERGAAPIGQLSRRGHFAPTLSRSAATLRRKSSPRAG